MAVESIQSRDGSQEWVLRIFDDMPSRMDRLLALSYIPEAPSSILTGQHIYSDQVISLILSFW